MLFWLIFALGFLAWGSNGLGARRNLRIMLRVALTPFLAPLLVSVPLLLLALTGVGLWRALVAYPALTLAGLLGLALVIVERTRTRRLHRRYLRTLRRH
jgi:hypothetical protein